MDVFDVEIFDSLDDEDLYQRRIRGPKKFKERKDYFAVLDEIEFFQRFRIRKRTARRVLAEIEDNIRSQTNQDNAVSPATKFLLTLRFFATGSMLIVVADFAGVSKAAACTTVMQVSQAIALLRPQYIKMATTAQGKRNVMEKFYEIARFPCILGAIDCTHIRLQSPGGNNAENFRNRKGYFSWNVQVVCDATLLINDIVVSWPGSAHDSTIFNASGVKTMFATGNMGNGILLGDSGYANCNYLVTPLADPNTPAQNLYNESHIRTRNVIERCFGVWKRRFPILSLGMRLGLQKSQTIVVATAVLHNIAVEEKNEEPDDGQHREEEDDGDDIQVIHHNINNVRRNEIIANHFSNILDFNCFIMNIMQRFV